jgi:signal transduction histidine kinase
VSPLRGISSLKLKLGIVIVAAVVVAVAATVFANDIGLTRRVGVLIAILLALVVVQLLARGMTAPLREMAAAAGAMARGEHGQRVSVRGRDEVAQLAEAFNAMSAELEETDRLRRELVANVSHELRTPLSALQVTLENLVDGVQPPDPATLAAMRQQVWRLGRMVEQLLNLSRMEAEGRSLELRRFEATGLLRRVREEARLQGAEGIRVETDVVPGDLALVGDQDRLHQVLTNLVDNALRFSPPAGTVSVAASAAPRLVRLSVSDQGPGIPEAERSRVFERFYSVDDSRSGRGAGLGLAITRWVVDLHGGAVRIEDADPAGCRVVVDLPQPLAPRVADASG